MRFSHISKRMDELEARMKVRKQGLMPCIDVFTWPEEDQLAYRFGTDEEQDALLEKHFGGPLPVGEPGSLDILYMVIGPTPHRSEERDRDEIDEPIEVMYPWPKPFEA